MGKTSRRAVLQIVLLSFALLALGPAAAQAATTVTTGSASNVTSTSATLNGTVAASSPATYYFEYGTSTAYGHRTAKLQISAGSHSVSATITGLRPGSTYDFRLVAQSTYDEGPAHGNNQTFSTPISPASTEPASAITLHSAKLNGFASTDAPSATWFFQYGRTTAYGRATKPQTISQGFSAVWKRVKHLHARTTYHFRLVVQQPGRAPDFGADSSFTTLPFGHAVLKSHRIAVRKGVASVPFKCKGVRGAPCHGRISLAARSRSGSKTTTVSCGGGRLFTSAKHRKAVHVRIGGACDALLHRARHGLSARLSARFSTHQRPLHAGVTLFGS